jgi:hypothetical protein
LGQVPDIKFGEIGTDEAITDGEGKGDIIEGVNRDPGVFNPPGEFTEVPFGVVVQLGVTSLFTKEVIGIIDIRGDSGGTDRTDDRTIIHENIIRVLIN